MAASLNKEIRYNDPLHNKIITAIRARYDLSVRNMSKKYEEYREAEERAVMYLPETENDSLRKVKRDQGVPQFTTVQIPYSYATALAAHTYWASVFLARNPALQYTARHGEPQMHVQAVEALMDYQLQVGKMLAPYYIQLWDVAKYGIGVLWNYWDVEKVNAAQIIEVPETYLGIPIPGKTKKQKVIRKMTAYEGNRLRNVKPQGFYPDPRVPITQVQEGEFVGCDYDVGWNTLVKGRESGRYFNVEHVRTKTQKMVRGSGWLYRDRGSSAIDLPEDADRQSSYGASNVNEVGFVTLLEMYIELIPKDWELGESRSPEIWLFTIANDQVIVEARPHGALHGKFPVSVLGYEIDGYVQHPRGMMEQLDPLNHTMEWLLNTHFYNVRSTLNNQWIVDPARVVMKDVTNPNPGKIIRLTEAAYGTDVRQAIQQLPVQDVTTGHLRDANIVMELIQRVSGVTDNIMGMVNQGGRKTATEVRTSSSFGINRLKTQAEYWSAGDWGTLAQIMLQNTQQYYDGEKQFKIVGDLANWAGDKYVRVTPEDIMGFYDFVPVDGTMPIDRYAQANLWREILMGIQKMPQIAQSYDISGIFAWMAQLAGLKNINQFRVQVLPDDQLQGAAAAGNVVPMGGANGPGAGAGGGASAGGTAPGAEGGLARVSEPGQVSGMGATG